MLLVSLIEALPKSCVNLEIDSRGWYENGITLPVGPHVCDSIRHILPRMNNVRLRLSTSCSSLFVDEEHGQYSSEPILLPNMKHLVVDCHPRTNIEGQSLPSDGLCDDPSQSAWNSVTSALQRLGKQDGSHRPDAQLIVTGHAPRDDDNDSEHMAILSTDGLTGRTWAMPLGQVFGDQDTIGTYWIRTRDGSELIGKWDGVYNVAEGATWTKTVNGTRVPTSLLKNRNKSALLETLIDRDAVPVHHSSDWKAENPTAECYLWDDEQQAGMKLGEAEDRATDSRV